jgi:hypothetical protein
LLRACRILLAALIEQRLDARRTKGDGNCVQATVVFHLLDEQGQLPLLFSSRAVSSSDMDCRYNSKISRTWMASSSLATVPSPEANDESVTKKDNSAVRSARTLSDVIATGDCVTVKEGFVLHLYSNEQVTQTKRFCHGLV